MQKKINLKKYKNSKELKKPISKYLLSNQHQDIDNILKPIFIDENILEITLFEHKKNVNLLELKKTNYSCILENKIINIKDKIFHKGKITHTIIIKFSVCNIEKK